MIGLHGVMTFVSWAIGILGVGGVVAAIAAAIFLGPTVVIAIVQPAFSRFLACTKCVVATVFVLATVGAYWLGHHEAVKACRADALEAELRNEKIDAQAARDAKADETRRADEIQQKAKEQHDTDQAYIAALQKRSACNLDDGDLNFGSVRKRAWPRLSLPAGKTK